ncbi:hypothetical protein [Micromonospora sp. RV43]|uniref:hypothetical protein n=1 Tax=Micromonospora sp. RV43 TaxID=1661387 RepID=UPI00064C1EE4|nr:hypothetical protein [Micromonospora sp. RV43]
MTRFWYGGTLADWTFTSQDGIDGFPDLVQAAGGIQVTFWDQETNGTQYEDLVDAANNPITFVVSSDGTDGRGVGTIAPFQGPDNVPAMWAEAAGGPRLLISGWTGQALMDVITKAGVNESNLLAHAAATNPHRMGMADATDVAVPAPEARIVGQVVGVLPGGGFGLLTPAQTSGAVLLNPPKSGGTYVGNVVQPPDPAQGQNGSPWLRMQAIYSADDNLPDMVQWGATTPGGLWVKTGWQNGNGEGRDAPSTANRVARRVFEYAQGAGGPSTGRFFELSTNPTQAAQREALFGAYGTGHSSQPGWMVATRVLAGLQGVRAGGGYNGLSPINFRGVRTVAGAPTTGTWITNDAVIDSAGALWVCTVAGTPGTWVTAAGGGASAAAIVTNVWHQETGAVGTGGYRFYNPTNSTLTLRSWIVSAGGTAPAGGDYVINPRLDGSPVYASANRPRITSGSRTSGRVTNLATTAWLAGSYLTVDIDSVGTTPPTKVSIQVEAS